MTTRFDNPLKTFQNKDDFYAAYPELAEGWGDFNKAPGGAPLGPDVHFYDESIVTVCAPHDEANASDMGGVTGVATEYDRKTGEIHVLAEDITHAEAERLFKP
jgi:hypothetical protein